MAEGDKIYIADKQTLDDVNSKVGQTGNTGGSASAGTIFGKLNAIISSIASFVANWTAARAAKVDNLDAKVSTRESETDAATRYNQLNTNTGVNNTASATGTLSQKLSHIINLFSSNKQKHLASKTVSVAVSTTGTHTLLNITGAGEFYMAFVNYMGDNYAEITFEIDGVSQMFRTYTNSSGYFAQRSENISQLLGVSSSLGSWMPIHFSKSLKVTVNVSNAAERAFAAKYAIYE